VSQFQSDPQTRLFLTTNAGSTGLNLQAANTVINVDLPWNPAVLEQRIARAHRMGQRRAVSVYVLVTEQTLEESLLATLSSKRDLALAALDPDSQATDVDIRTQADDIKAKLEILLGTKPPAPVDETATRAACLSVSTDRSAAGGAFVRAALDLLDPGDGGSGAAMRPAIAEALRAALDAKVVEDERGRPRLSLAMPSREALAGLLRGIAGFLVGATDGAPTRSA
jgi:hypothetical protein